MPKAALVHGLGTSLNALLVPIMWLLKDKQRTKQIQETKEQQYSEAWGRQRHAVAPSAGSASQNAEKLDSHRQWRTPSPPPGNVPLLSSPGDWVD